MTLSYVRRSWNRYPTPHYPILAFYQVVYFATPWCWLPLARRGTIVTAAPNPSTSTSSKGLRQCCLCLVWVGSKGGASRSSTVYNCLVHISLIFFSTAPHCCTLLALPSLIIDRHPCLVVLPLPPHLCGNTFIAVPLSCLCWSGAIILLPLPYQSYCCIRTAATTTRLSPCHCRQCTSLTSDVSPLAVFANANTNVVIVSPQLWQRYVPCLVLRSTKTLAPLSHVHCLNDTFLHCPFPLWMPLSMPTPSSPSMLIVVHWFYSLKPWGVVDSTLWLRI